MRHLFSTRIRVVLVVALLLAVSLAVISSLTGFSLPDMMVKGVLTPLRSGVSKITEQAQQIYNYMFQYEALAAENEALKQQLSQMENDAREAAAIARENERLREALKLKEIHEDFELVDGYIISWSSTEWTSTLTINRGTNVGIKVGQVAITANGEVVGLVSEAGPNYAVVKTVMDSSLEISASITSGVSGSSIYNGMVQGGYATGQKGFLRMDYLPRDAAIRNQDRVVTAGSTVYPRNLILGYVTYAGFDGIGVAKYALLKPAADLNSLEQVFIITQYNAG